MIVTENYLRDYPVKDQKDGTDQFHPTAMFNVWKTTNIVVFQYKAERDNGRKGSDRNTKRGCILLLFQYVIVHVGRTTQGDNGG